MSFALSYPNLWNVGPACLSKRHPLNMVKERWNWHGCLTPSKAITGTWQVPSFISKVEKIEHLTVDDLFVEADMNLLAWHNYNFWNTRKFLVSFTFTRTKSKEKALEVYDTHVELILENFITLTWYAYGVWYFFGSIGVLATEIVVCVLTLFGNVNHDDMRYWAQRVNLVSQRFSWQGVLEIDVT